MSQVSIPFGVQGVQEVVWSRIVTECADLAGRFLNRVMEAERDVFLGCVPYERTPVRRGRRNGYEPRRLDSQFGPLKLRAPKVRDAGGPFRSECLSRYQRRQAHLERCILRWVAGGLSTRAVARAADQAFGATISAATVSRIVAKLDEEMEAFRDRPLRRGVRYLYLDGKHGAIGRPARHRGRGRAKKAVLLLAWAIDHDGREDLVDFQVAPDESEASWDTFLQRLRRRGLVEEDPYGERLERILSDGDAGIAAALALNYPSTPHQICVFHKIQRIADHLVDRDHRDAIQGEAGQVFEAATRAECLARLRRWTQRWGPLEPEAVAQFTRDLDRMVLFYDSPPGLHRRLKTTNALERFIRELERKFAQAGPYPNARAWERATYLVYRELRHAGYAPFRSRHSFTRVS